jgi:hypothetical protein
MASVTIRLDQDRRDRRISLPRTLILAKKAPDET